MVMEVGRSKLQSWTARWRLREKMPLWSGWKTIWLQSQERVCVLVQIQRPFAAELPCALVVPSTDWTRSTHVLEGHLLYSKSTDVNVNLT